MPDGKLDPHKGMMSIRNGNCMSKYMTAFLII